MRAAPFTSLYFGKSDPIHEALDNPKDFIRSYVDLDDSVSQVVSGKKTLILGPKGTGKSALGLFLSKTDDSRVPKTFSRMRNASKLPLAEIPQLNTGEPRGALRTYNAWKFILLCNYLDVALEDTQTTLPHLMEVKRVIRLLRSFGFVGSDSGERLLKVAGTSYEFPVDSARSLFREERGGSVNIFTLTPYLERWSQSLKSSSRHILVLDGLDSIFLNDSRYDESISGLTQAAYDLNLNFRQAGSTGSIVLLIRNDIFSRISLLLPDAHKMRDFGFDLDWRILSGAAGENAPLIRLVNSKASQERGGEAVDVLSYFPPEIQTGFDTNRFRRGRRRRDPSRLQYLLNLTRHTPRDILQLMEYIRLAAKNSGDQASPYLSPETIREGAVQYSTKYFVDAIRGEFAGYEGGVPESEAALNALKLVEEKQFTRSDYRNSLRLHSPGLEAKTDDFLRLLFYAGALGNLFNNGRERYMVFYHRRNDVDLNTQGPLVLHNALTHAWSRGFGLRAAT